MTLNFVRLLWGTFLGSFATFINVAQPLETFNNHISAANSIVGLLIGIVTFAFLILQIAKIILGFKDRKSNLD